MEELSLPEALPEQQASPDSPGSSSSPSSSSSSSSSSSAASFSFRNSQATVEAAKPEESDDEANVSSGLVVDGGESENEGFVSGEEDFEPAFVGMGNIEVISGGGGGGFVAPPAELSRRDSLRPIAKVSIDDDDDDDDDAGVDDDDYAFNGSESRILSGEDTEIGKDEAGLGKDVNIEELVKENGVGDVETYETVVSVERESEVFDGENSGDVSEVVEESVVVNDRDGFAGEDSVVEAVQVEVPNSGVAVVGNSIVVSETEDSKIPVTKGVELANEFNALELVGSKSLPLDSECRDEGENSGEVVEESVAVNGSVGFAGEDSVVESVQVEVSNSGVAVVGDSKDVIVVSETEDRKIPVAEPVELANDFDALELVGSKSLPLDSESIMNVVEASREEGVVEAETVVAGSEEVVSKDMVGGEVDEEDEVQAGDSDETSMANGASDSKLTLSREIVLEDEEGTVSGSDSDEEAEGTVYGKAAKKFFEGIGSSPENSQRIDGQIVTDSDEDADTDEDEGGGKELFDSAALAALLKAATGASSDGGNVTITSADGSRLFSMDRPAGLGSSLPKFTARPSHSSLFAPSNSMVAAAEESLSEEEKARLEKFQQLRVKYLRLVNRLGVSSEEPISRQVLYRLALVAGRVNAREFSVEAARATALQLEAEARESLDFSVNILVLGKSGVGKSATINSIFGEEKTPIYAFGPSTTAVKEIVGTVDGVKIRVFDTPGLTPAAMEQNHNRKILASVKSATKKSPPDIILYVDRLDTQSRDLNDLPMLRSITSTLGPSIWRSAIVSLTHAASSPPDGPTGLPLNYELFVAQRSQIVQQSIGQAVGDLRVMSPSLMNLVTLVENHPSCRKNRDGHKVLPNGQTWRSHLLHLCYSMKVVAEASNLSKPQEAVDTRKLFGFRVRSPPLPLLLSWLLQSRTHPKLAADQGGENGDSDVDLDDLSDSDAEEDDEFDQLPPFKPLRKAQLGKLTKDQKKAYLEEYDYRVKVLQKKQWREELKRMKEMKKNNGKPRLGADEYEDDPENGAPAAVPVALPDMILPPSFDSDSSAYRYRFLEPTSQFLARPVLDTHGWDHDCGYDGVNVEYGLALANRFPGAIAVQVTKDKKEFNIHVDSSVAAKHGESGSTMVGFDVQNMGKQLAYVVRGETKFRTFRKNRTAMGGSVTFLGENVTPGIKIEDQIAIGKNVVLVGSTAMVKSQSESAYGANLEVRLRESDFPVGQDHCSLGLSLVKWRGDLALGANFQAGFSVGRSYKVAVRTGVNNKMSGQISIRTSSSEQMQIALVALLPIVKSICKILWPASAGEDGYSMY